jgi:hypothetical protein
MNPSGAVQTSTTRSPIDVLNDTLAYHEALNTAIRQQELDDTHDLRGMTLYNLQFDVAVEPGNNGDNFAIVFVEPTRSKIAGALKDGQQAFAEMLSGDLPIDWGLYRASKQIIRDRLSDINKLTKETFSLASTPVQLSGIAKVVETIGDDPTFFYRWANALDLQVRQEEVVLRRRLESNSLSDGDARLLQQYVINSIEQPGQRLRPDLPALRSNSTRFATPCWDSCRLRSSSDKSS